MRNGFKGNKLLTLLALALLVLCGLIIVYLNNTNSLNMPPIAIVWMMAWLCSAILFTLLSYRVFVVGYLLGLFALMVSWRIAAIYDIDTITYPFFIVFILYLVNFIYCVKHHLTYQTNNPISLAEWQLIFVRIYIGFNFIPHFTEKLFAGPEPYFEDVKGFIALGVPHADYFVWLAGCCEFAAAIALGLGFFMRIGALGSALYLLIATCLGHHFNLGFIWASVGGGWEFAVMWSALIVSFVMTDSHRFSLGEYMESRFSLPPSIKKLL